MNSGGVGVVRGWSWLVVVFGSSCGEEEDEDEDEDGVVLRAILGSS